MNTNKKFFLLISLVCICSCSVKKDAILDSTTITDTNTNISVLEGAEKLVDRDSDGVPDIVEVSRGTNPLVADIPRLSINLVSEISLSGLFREEENKLRDESLMLRQVFNEVQGEKAGDLDFLKVLRKKVVKNQYSQLRNIQAEKQDVIVNEDLRTTILSRWDDKVFYPVVDSLSKITSQQSNPSGKYDATIRLKITDASHVTQISNINVKSIYYNFKSMEESEIYNQFLLKKNASKEKIELFGNDVFIPAIEYNLFANELETNSLSDKIINRNEVGLKFVNYDYVTSGINLSYAEVISNVLNNNAKIIFSNGKTTEVHFVSSNMTLSEALKILNKKVETDKNGDVLSIDGLETNAQYPVDLDVIRTDDLNTGIWSVVGESDNLSEIIKPQGIYVVSYSTISDLLNASMRDYEHYPIQDSFDKIHLKNIYQNDEVTINVSQLIKNEHIVTSQTQKYTIDGTGPGCMAIPSDPSLDDKRGPKDCNNKECTKVISSIQIVQNISNTPTREYLKWIRIKYPDGSDVDYEIFYYSNFIKIKFSKHLKYSKNDITVFLQNEHEQTKSLKVGVTDSCTNQSFGTETRKDYFAFDRKVTIFGAARY